MKANSLLGSSEGLGTRPVCGVMWGHRPWVPCRGDLPRRLTFLVTLATLSFLRPRLSFVPSGVTLGAFCHTPCAHPPPALTRQAGAGTCLQDEGMNEEVGPEPPSLPGPSSALVPQLPQL